MRISGETAVVTGGTGAIGRAIVTRLRMDGATVVPWDVAGDQETIACDIADPVSVRAAMTATVARVGPPSIMVAAAGVSVGMAPVAGPDADWDQVFSDGQSWDRVLGINLVGTVLCVREAARLMVEHGRAGSIVTVSSVNGGPIAEPGFAAYSCAKAGVDMFTRIAAAELGPFGIRVNAVAPGVMAHPMSKATSPRSAGARGPELAGVVKARTPVEGRLGTAEDIADAVSALITAGWVTGQILTVDGGLTLASPIDAAGLIAARTRAS